MKTVLSIPWPFINVSGHLLVDNLECLIVLIVPELSHHFLFQSHRHQDLRPHSTTYIYDFSSFRCVYIDAINLAFHHHCHCPS